MDQPNQDKNRGQNGDVTINVNPKNIFQVWLTYTGIKCGCVLVLVIAIIIFCGYFLVKSWQPGIINPIGSSFRTPGVASPTASTSYRSGFVKYINEDYGFSLDYPSNWQNAENNFSPQEIKYYDIGSVNAPIYFLVIPKNDFNSSNIKYQIDNDKKNQSDSTVKVDGKIFQKYDLIDYGTYEGDSAGRVLIYKSPELNINSVDSYLVFHWQEKPASETIIGNDPQVFEQMIQSLKFND